MQGVSIAAMKTYLCVYLGSLALALLTTPVVIWLARRLHAVDYPNARSVHRRPLPRIGGVAIYVSAMSLIIAVLFSNSTVGAAFKGMQVQLIALLGAATLIFLLGLMDDLRHLPARFKFLVELILTVALCFAGVRIDSITITDNLVLHLGSWGWLLTWLWVVGVTNAVNLCDGLDGLAAGVSAVTCSVIAIFAIHSGDRILTVVMLSLVGSLCGFLVFNWSPAKIFMGDCGSLFLGFVIAAASVLCVAKSTALVGITLPALALGIPIFDTLFSMLRRFLDRRSLFAPDHSHFHHRLLDLGFHHRHAVMSIYLATLLAAGLGLFMLIRNDVGSLVVFVCVLLLIILLFRVVGAVHLKETFDQLQTRHAYARQERQLRETFEDLQLKFRRIRNQTDWRQAAREAAQRLDLAWLSLQTKDADGSVDVFIWRLSSTPSGPQRVITMTLPIDDARRNGRVELEIAVMINDSLELASQRAGLFSRLIDECTFRDLAVIPSSPPPETPNALSLPVSDVGPYAATAESPHATALDPRSLAVSDES